jgi:hypothetical protein
MIFMGPKLVLSCCLLMAAEGFVTNSYARQEVQRQPEIKQDLATETDLKKAEASVSGQKMGAIDGQIQVPQFEETKLGLSLIKNIALDQKAMWTSPSRLHLEDANWLVPLAGVTAASLASDTGLSRALTGSPSRVSRSTTFSNYGVGALGAVTGGMYLWGEMVHDDHRTETGLLSGEAAVDAVAMTTVFQYAFGRQRPTDGSGGGGFWEHGTSFPSDHSAAAWAIASVMAHEYPGTLSKLFFYGLASAVSMSRVTGKDHFSTDVLIGGAIGWFTGRRVFLAHHDPEMGGSTWGLPFEDEDARERGLPGKNAASTFVSLDSWVYPAFARLASMGFVTSAIQGEKPWTRMECARLTEEVGDAFVEATHEDHEPNDQAVQIDEALKREFAQEIAVLNGGRNRSLTMDSVYTRVMSISGPILTDGYNFGQTISYDFGRPFRRGTNVLAGASARASEGPLAIFVRVEYQHSPSAPPVSDSVLQFISKNDVMPLQAAHPFAPVNRADLLEGYLTFNHSGWQVTAGKQALSWNVGEGGSMLLSDNAEPLYMIRLTRVVPMELPGPLKSVRLRTDWFLGKLDRGVYVPNRLFFGQKFSLAVTPYLEIGLGRTMILGRGQNAMNGDAFTTANFFDSFFGVGPRPNFRGVNQFQFDFNLDVPGLRHSVSFYGDLFEDDKVIYFINPPRGAYRAGMFVPRLPHLSRVDFRVESTSTESPDFNFQEPVGGHLNYYDGRYRDGYINYGQLMGNTVSRQGRIFQGWTTFHASALHEIQFSVSDHQIDPRFIPGGGLWQDYTLSHEIHLQSGFYAKSSVQFEHIQHYPMLFTGIVNNVTGSVEIGFAPVWSKQ